MSVDYGPATRAALEGLQLERLRATVAHAYANSRHYARALDEHGVGPDDIRSLADIARLPFTTKGDLRATYPFGMLAVPMSEVSRIHASSGTTGKPTVVGYTRADIATWSSLVARSLHAAGVRAGMKVHVAYGYGLFTGGLGAHYGAEALGCTVIPMSGGQTEKQVQLIGDFQPDAIMITPSYMLSLLDEFRRQGIDPRSSSLRHGIFGAEPWTEAMRREIEDSFDLQATDIYGLSEVMGPGVAQEFAGDGAPTIWEDHFYPEIVDPLTGEVLPDGEIGELVLTSLTKQGMPVVRYRTRDLTRLLPGTARPMRRIEKITGRSDDMIILRGVNLFPTQIEELILRTPRLAPHFQCVLSRADRLDALTVKVERRAGEDPAAAAVAGQDLVTAIKNTIGVSVRVEVIEPDGVERSAGKMRRIVDLRPRG